jgi:hypothetical protein
MANEYDESFWSTPVLSIVLQTDGACPDTIPPPPTVPPRQGPKVPPVAYPIPPPPPGGKDSDPVNPLALINFDCVSWQITGVCACNPQTPCVTVEYWEPGWLIETVKRPGVTGLLMLAPQMAIVKTMAASLWGGSGAGNAKGGGHTNLQYNEVHVITFPDLLGGPCTTCGGSSSQNLTLHYASELDSKAWRMSTATETPLNAALRIGVWARLYPRTGFAIHSSEPVGSGIAAYRGFDIARQPIATPPNVETHLVQQPITAMSTCMQLASPVKRRCMEAGTPGVIWETGTVDKTGTYQWIIWKKQSCCVNPANSSCGITQPGIGGQGGNICLIPTAGQ